MEGLERDDKGFIRVYSFHGLGAIFYRTLPPSESLALEDLSISSRLTPKEGQTIFEKLISKSDSITKKNTNIEGGLLDLNDAKKINLYFSELEKRLDESTRPALYNIQSVLGHRNIGEQSNMMVSMALPEISALSIQDEVFMASQERSTRYVDFSENYTPQDSSTQLKAGYSILSQIYQTVFNHIKESTSQKFKLENMRGPSDDEIKGVITPTARDSARSFVPLGAMTSLVISINARTAENISRKLLSSSNLYNNEVGQLFSAVIKDNVPSLTAHADPGRYNTFIYPERAKFSWLSAKRKPTFSGLESVLVDLGEGSQTEQQAYMSIYTQMPEDYRLNTVKQSVDSYLKNLSYNREGKYDDLNDSLLRSTFLQFEITCSLGTARDLWRHRLASRNINIIPNTYILPDTVYSDKRLLDYTQTELEDLGQVIMDLYETEKGSEAELLVPMATQSKLKMSMSLAEAIFIAENRSTAEAHPEYRKIAFGIHESLKDVYPHLINDLRIFMGNAGLMQPGAGYSREIKPKTKDVNDTLF